MDKGFLVLEDGSVFEGRLLNGLEKVGEVVFNTSHSGYEEMATDPSYFNQILVTTAPMQGNYGVSREHWESESFSISGFVCLEMQNSKRDSSWLDRLTENKVPVLSEVDTRKLTLHLRDQGSVWGGVFAEKSLAKAQEKIDQRKKSALNTDWTELLSVKEPKTFTGEVASGPRIALVDFGYKKNILRELVARASEVCVFPSGFKAEDILGTGFEGVMLSNGPGDPSLVSGPLIQIQALLGKLPIFGICMGHQLLGRALGVETFKLKFGHRGANHPIQDLKRSMVYMSSQNHGYALKAEAMPAGVEVTHINLNDKSVAGIEAVGKKAFSVQFHPESHPGPHEAVYLFDEFIKMIENFKSQKTELGVGQSV